MNQESAFEPTVLGALWRYRWLVILIVVAFLALGYFYARNLPVQYEAVATLVVEDPRATAVFETGAAGRPERYVNNQASILASESVAQGAAELASESGQDFTSDEISEGLTIEVFEESDEIGVAFTGDSAEEAVIGANSVARSYESTRRQAVSGTYDQALEQLDASIQELDQRLADIASQIRSAIGTSPSYEALQQQYDEALTRLSELQASLPGASLEAREVIRASLDDVQRQLETLGLVLSLEQTSPEVSTLLEEQSRIIERREQLRARHDEVEVDSSLESTGIVLFSPAVNAEETGSSLVQALAAALVLGAVLATVVAYRRAVQNRRFFDRSQPEQVLGVPLLTEVPDFREEKVGTLPVRTHPASASAEAFRFVIPAISRASVLGAEARPLGEGPINSFVIVSAASGDGKSVITANLALAAALQQRKVLAVDADFGDQQLTKLLTETMDVGELGLSDLSNGKLKPRDVINEIAVPGFPRLHLVSRGESPTTAPEFFGSEQARSFFAEVRDEYDLVLIDAPPLLQVAYTSSLVSYADRAIVVVPHGSSVGRLEEMANRLRLMDGSALGYVYAKAPLRFDLPRSEGSMKDILGAGRPR